MVGVAPFGGSVGRGDASAALFFDPNAFPAAVASVARACNGIETIAEAIPATSVDPGAFGAVGAAWLAFHRAWSGEVATARSAFDEMVAILPVAGHAYVRADRDASP